MDNSFSYDGLNASTLVAEPNASYLSNIGHTPTIAPMDSPTLGLMMLLSTFQYQAPYMNPIYSAAASQAGKAAYIVSGGQAIQDKLADKGKDTAYSLGLTNTEMGLVLGTAKTVRDRQLVLNGPRMYGVKSTLTGAQNSGSLGLKYEW